MEFKIEVSDEELAKSLECKGNYIIEEILSVLRSYDMKKAENEDFRCIEEIVSLLKTTDIICRLVMISKKYFKI